MNSTVNNTCIPQLDFGVVDNATCNLTLEMFYFEYGIYIGVDMIFIVIFTYIITNYFINWCVSMVDSKPVFLQLRIFHLCALATLQLSCSLYFTMHIITMVYQRSNDIAIRFVFWFALSFLVVGSEVSLFPIKKFLDGILNGNTPLSYNPWYVNPILPILNIVFAIPGFVLSVWDVYTTTIHISLTSAWIFGNTVFSTLLWSYMYYTLKSRLNASLKNRATGVITVTIIQLGFNIIVLLLTMTSFAMAMTNTARSESVFQVACIFIIIKHIVYYFKMIMRFQKKDTSLEFSDESSEILDFLKDVNA